MPKSWETNTGISNTLWLPGLGDHGGGPTRDMLEKAERWQRSPFFPTLGFTIPSQYIDSLPVRQSNRIEGGNETDIPTWQSELYLELHRGCYTTHADQKRHNRRSEDLLYQAEVFATLAQLTANHPYPKADIETAWKALLFNQFHDILPGTSIPEVFTEANKGWEQVEQIGQKVLDESLKAIATTIDLPSPPHPKAKPIIVFNPLTWPQDAVITFDLSAIDLEKQPLNWTIYNQDQQIIPSQNAPDPSDKKSPHQVSFLALDLPALGYQYYWIQPSTSPIDTSTPTAYILENQFLKASINPHTGQITSLIEKSTQTEALSAPGNQLQTFSDRSGYWDAWNIAPDYEQHPLTAPELISVGWHETGPVRQCIRTIHKTEKSTLCQDYILGISSPFLTIKSNIFWQETQVLLKVNFPVATPSDEATYEMPFGAIARTTNPQTAAEKAQWEVPALRWADVGDRNFGVSILTNCKHGFDASPHHIRLTLLKSSTWPDPSADQGTHQFTYAIYPHPHPWQKARTVQHARALNISPITYQPEEVPAHTNQKTNKKAPNHLSTSKHQSFLRIHNTNIIMSALKPTEDNPDEFILRSYEAHGESTHLDIEHPLELSALSEEAERTNLLEASIHHAQPTLIKPWQISTYRLTRKGSANS